ncbi:MAG: PhzF family phenazine biosynthesis protein [Anaerolineaceae bacterium]|nr:PhzF family phenazine biosynthesis protein [Anaerolineaceae bacterium]
MKIPFYQVDAFALSPFKGNPAAVVILEKARSEAWMQSVASEMALSETAFLVAKGDGYNLRWFTPTTEVELCGHATLASAHVLYEFGFYEPDEQISFYTKSGTITSSFSKGTIELDMPRRDPKSLPANQKINELLGVNVVALADFNGSLLLAELENAAAVSHFVPDFRKINEIEQHDVLITAQGDEGFDFVSRFFSPKTGIFEDPVTGMAHCSLAPYWAFRLGKTSFHALQASKRSGELWVRLGEDRVYLAGKAVTVLQGDILHQKD